MKATIITGTEKEMAALAMEMGGEEDMGELVMLREPYSANYSLLRVRRDAAPQASEPKTAWRRLIPLTNNKHQLLRLDKLMDKKGLTREDLIFILSTVTLNPDLSDAALPPDFFDVAAQAPDV